MHELHARRLGADLGKMDRHCFLLDALDHRGRAQPVVLCGELNGEIGTRNATGGRNWTCSAADGPCLPNGPPVSRGRGDDRTRWESRRGFGPPVRGAVGCSGLFGSCATEARSRSPLPFLRVAFAANYTHNDDRGRQTLIEDRVVIEPKEPATFASYPHWR